MLWISCVLVEKEDIKEEEWALLQQVSLSVHDKIYEILGLLLS